MAVALVADSEAFENSGWNRNTFAEMDINYAAESRDGALEFEHLQTWPSSITRDGLCGDGAGHGFQTDVNQAMHSNHDGWKAALNGTMNFDEKIPPGIRGAGFSLCSKACEWYEPNDLDMNLETCNESKALQDLDDCAMTGWPMTLSGSSGEMTMNFTNDIVDYDFEELAVDLENYDFEIAALGLVMYVFMQFSWLVESVLKCFMWFNGTFIGMICERNTTIQCLTSTGVGIFWLVKREWLSLGWMLSPDRTFLADVSRVLAAVANVILENTNEKPLQYGFLMLIGLCVIWLLATRNNSMVCNFALNGRSRSRMNRRRLCRSRSTMRRQLGAMICLCMFWNVQAMQQAEVQEAILQRMMAMTEAATRAAAAAEAAMTSSAGASSSSDGLQSASKVLKNPDTYNGEDAMGFALWRFQFTSWLTYGDTRYADMLTKVDKMTDAPDIATYTDDQKQLAHRLYAVLTSYLRGKCAHLAKAVSKSRDGFLVWFRLIHEYEPSSRQRTLALAQALASYPTFPKEKSAFECVLLYEEVVQRFEEASSTTYPEELKIAILMRCCNQRLREHLQLNLDDKSTYSMVKESIMNFERVSKAWSQESVLKSIQNDDGPTPMEIDRVEDYKGKGKGKYKGKHKSSWGVPWPYGRGGGRGKGKSKGKGKKGGRGKGRGGGKSKGKGKKGGGKSKGQKGKLGENQCKLCFQYGHWSGECPNKMDVNNVQQQNGPGSPPNPGSPQSPQKTSGTTSPYSSPQTQGQAQHQPMNMQTAVTRIFHIPSPPTSPSSHQHVAMVLLEEIPEGFHDAVLQVGHDEEWIILDSGSDVSLLPARYKADSGSPVGHQLRNCQGGSLETRGTRFTDLCVRDQHGEEVLLRHEFIVGDVTTGLVSLGQLYQAGWKVTNSDGGNLFLTDPNEEVKIPVHFRNRSFAIKAYVRMVTDNNDAQDEPILEVRAIVSIYDEIEETEMNSWGMTSEGTPYYKTLDNKFLDPRAVWGQYWPFRTTLIRVHQGEDRNWLLVELAQKYMELEDPFGVIEDCVIRMGGQECEVLTVLGVQEHNIDEIGALILDEGEDFLALDPQDDAFLPRNAPPGLEGDAWDEFEAEYQDELAEDPEQEQELGDLAAPPQEDVEKSEVIYLADDYEVTAHSKIKDLRVACKWMGISQSGSRLKLFNRLYDEHLRSLKRAAVEIANKEYQEQEHEAVPVKIPLRQPSERERSLHELTHLPFRDWCPHCVATRSKADHQASIADPQDAADRDRPTIQLDFFFSEKREDKRNAVLLMIDSWTRFCSVEPMARRTGKAVGEALTRFIGTLGYVGTVEICADNELMAGVELCKTVRGRQGFTTTVRFNKNYSKRRTAMAERAIQTIRNLQKTLVAQLESETQCLFPNGHPVLYWASMHAAWLYNRYHMHSSIKITPYQAIFGRPYKNKVANFGQIVYGLDPKGTKYRPLWKRGVWLGRDASDHDILATGPKVITKTKAVRRTAHVWCAEDILAIEIGPWDTTGYTHSKVKAQALTSQPMMLASGGRDLEAEAVANVPPSPDEVEQPEQVQDDYAPTTPASDTQRDMREIDEMLMSVPGKSKSALDLLTQPVAQPIEMMGGNEPMEEEDPHGTKHAAESIAGEPEAKAMRFDDDPTPEPKSKAAKTEVRLVNGIEITHNDELGIEEFVDAFLEDMDIDWETELIQQRAEGDGPPDVSEETLEELDRVAGLEEVEKLYKMGVIEPKMIDLDGVEPHQLVDTTIAKDRRYRDGWKRRCRIVAREFRSGQQTDEANFAPTSTFGAIRMLMVFSMVYNLSLTALDVKDAFLLVPQQELLYVLIPEWIVDLSDNKQHNVWELRRCLPGQRNAALRWHEYFSEKCIEAGMVAYPGCPTIMMLVNEQRRIYLNIHVDDILLVCNDEDLKWFQEKVTNQFTIKMDGPHAQDSGEVLFYLKKKITMTPEGVLIQPNGTYIPKLLNLLKVSGRRKKSLPHHSTLEAYNQEKELEELPAEEVKTFRSALGLILYISHDRPDIGFATKILATWMSRPCAKAMAAVKHMASYLSGSEQGGVLLRKCQTYDLAMDRWHEAGDVIDPSVEQRGDRSEFNLEIYTDSSWGDDKSTRKSTSSATIFLNGCYVTGFSRGQATIALSSCEAELYAANAGVAEGLFLLGLLKFLTGDKTDGNNEKVRLKLYTDSSSAMGTVQRKGVGRMKHIQIRHLYLQEVLRKKVISIHKVPTKDNPADIGTKKLAAERRTQLGKLIGQYPREEQEDRSWQHSRRVQAAMVVALQTFAMALKGCDGQGEEPGWSLFWLTQAVVMLGVFSMIGMMIPGRGPGRGRAPGRAGSGRLPRGSVGRKGAGKGRKGSSAAGSTTVDLDPIQQGGRSHTSHETNLAVQTTLSRDQIKQLGVMFVMASYEFWTNGGDHDGVLRTLNQIRALYILWTQNDNDFIHDFLESTNGTEDQVMAALNELRHRVGLPRKAYRGLRSTEEWLWWHLRNYAAGALADESPRHPLRKRLDEMNGEFEDKGHSPPLSEDTPEEGEEEESFTDDEPMDDFGGSRPLGEDFEDPRYDGDTKNSGRKARRIAKSAVAVGNLMNPGEGTTASRCTVVPRDDESEVSWNPDDDGKTPSMTAIGVVAWNGHRWPRRLWQWRSSTSGSIYHFYPNSSSKGSSKGSTYSSTNDSFDAISGSVYIGKVFNMG